MREFFFKIPECPRGLEAGVLDVIIGFHNILWLNGLSLKMEPFDLLLKRLLEGNIACTTGSRGIRLSEPPTNDYQIDLQYIINFRSAR